MTQEKKYPIPTQEQEDIEESLSAIWHQFELGVHDKAKILAVLEEGVSREAFPNLVRRKLALEDGGNMALTDEGEALA